MDREKAIKILENNRQELLTTFGVNKIGIFGSIVTGDLTADSDIDIVVEISKDKKQLHNFLSLKRYLEKIFGKPVDLGIESTLKPIVRDAIIDKIIYV